MKNERPSPPRLWLRAGEQIAAASLLAMGLIAIGMHYWLGGGFHGRLIEIEQAAPRPAQYWVDINTGGIPEFILLPEIGESLARRIVEDRAERGPFRDHNDLRRVRGIGPKTLERIKPYLRPMPPVEATAGP
jgi:competence protein ComEA